MNAQTNTSGFWQYTTANSEATIVGYTGSSNSTTIPGIVDGIAVKKIGNGNNVSGLTNVTNIVISEGATNIGNKAFENLSALRTVSIPSTMAAIGQAAFSSTGILSIDLSGTSASLSNNVFYNCTSLTNAKLPLNLNLIQSGLFFGNSNLSEVVIPYGVTSIQNGAFENCTNLTKVYFLGNAPDNSTGTQFNNCPAALYILPTATGWGSSYAGRPTASVSSTEILTSPNKFQLFSSSQMNSNRIVGRSDVTSSPSTYGLYTASQYNANYAAGQSTVMGNPNAYELYTTNQITTLAFGGLTLRRDYSGQFFLNYVIEQSDNLRNWSTYQEYELPITNLPSNKAFLRILPAQVTEAAILNQKVAAVINQIYSIRGASWGLIGKYRVFFPDGTQNAVYPGTSEPWIRNYGDEATLVSAANTTFGDLLLSEGALDNLKISIGAYGYPNPVTYAANSIGLAQESTTRITPINSSAINYPLILCRNTMDNTGRRIFTASINATRTVFLLIPGLTLSEAAALKKGIDWPDLNLSAAELVAKAVAGNATGPYSDLINMGNCRLTQSPLPGGGYDAWCYIDNE